MADHLPRYAPGKAVTYTATAAVTGGRLVTVSGDRTVAHTSAAGVVAGVAARDAAIDQDVLVLDGGIHELTATAVGIAAGARVVSAAGGLIAALGAGAAVDVIGHTEEAIAASGAGRVRLYH